jgi:hypothetical protein
VTAVIEIDEGSSKVAQNLPGKEKAKKGREEKERITRLIYF